MEYNLLDPAFITQTIAEIESDQNQKRKKEAYKSYQCYDGNLSFFTQERIKEMYPKTWAAFTISDYSVEKKIVDTKSKSYKESPIRKLQNQGKDNETETELYQKILKDANANESFRRFDRFKNQHKYAGMAVFREKETDIFGIVQDKIKLIPLAPYEFDLIRDDNGVPRVWILSYPDSSVIVGPNASFQEKEISLNDGSETEERLYAFWSETQHVLIKAISDKGSKTKRIEYMEIPNNPGFINPYGVLNFLYCPLDYTDEYPIASPLADQTIELNALLSVYLSSANMQIGQLVLKYPEDQTIDTVISGLMTAIKLPQSNNPDAPETSAAYISPAPNMEGHKDAILTYMNMILDQEGINSNQVINPTEKFTSGFDRLLSSADVQSLIEDNQDLYARVENDLYKILKKMFEFMDGKTMFKSESLMVTFKKPKMLVSDTERLQNIKLMQELGLLEDYEKFLIVDPNLTEDQAKEKAKKVKAEKQSQLKELMGQQQGNQDPGSQKPGSQKPGSKKPGMPMMDDSQDEM